MQRDAVFSRCGSYRYALSRSWDPAGRHVVFVGLNPSTADDTVDDPTIRRCIGFARRWGFGGLQMLNLFALRATLPQDMLAHPEPEGADNDAHLVQHAKAAALVVAAWGNLGTHRGRDRRVRELLPDLHCLRLTKQGQPAHPLYLPGTLQPVPWPAGSP